MNEYAEQFDEESQRSTKRRRFSTWSECLEYLIGPDVITSTEKRDNKALNNALGMNFDDLNVLHANLRRQAKMGHYLTVDYLARIQHRQHQNRSGRDKPYEQRYVLTYLLEESSIVGVERFLRKYGDSISTMDSSGQYPLHVSAARGDFIMIYYLLHRDVGTVASVNAYNFEGNQAIHMAALNDETTTIKVLLRLGAEIDAPQFLPDKETEGDTPLHCAAGSGSVNCCKFLIDEGADMYKKNRFGDTALHVAILGLSIPVFKYLLDLGGYLSIRNNMGRTPSMLIFSLLDREEYEPNANILKKMVRILNSTGQF